jgi:hypothetical protein
LSLYSRIGLGVLLQKKWISIGAHLPDYVQNTLVFSVKQRLLPVASRWQVRELKAADTSFRHLINIKEDVVELF